MKIIYNGSIKGLLALVDRINNNSGFHFFSNNKIIHAKLRMIKLFWEVFFFKGIGQLYKNKDSIKIQFKFRLRVPLVFMGILVVIILIGFLLGENIIINGETNPLIWKRLAFVSVGFIASVAFPSYVFIQLKSNFKRKVEKLIK